MSKGGASQLVNESLPDVDENWDSYGWCHNALRHFRRRITDSIVTVPGSVWFYQPNKIAPPIFAAAYLASGAVHAWQT
jgi:hypothetical protein